MVNGHALPEADGVISKAQFLLNTSALSAENSRPISTATTQLHDSEYLYQKTKNCFNLKELKWIRTLRVAGSDQGALHGGRPIWFSSSPEAQGSYSLQHPRL